MINSKHIIAPIFSLVLLLSGCVIGKTGLLFVTKTNAGLDVSTTPPTAELTISRVEGVVGPQFENGQTLPVMSSFKFENTGIFAPHVGSAFATGDAAVTMAGLYGDDTFGRDWNARASLLKPENEANSPTNSKLSLDNEPDPGHLLPLPELPLLNPKLKYQKNDVRPVFFGTDTAIGIKVAWSGMTGQYPDTAKFGYNRKELALVPVSMKETTAGVNTVYEMKIASLLATLDSGVKANGAANLDAMHIQYFATGNAATLLAMQKDVRAAMLARLDPNKEAYKKRFGEKLDEKTKTVAFVLLNPIYDQLRKIAGETNDVKAKALADRMDSLEPPGLKHDFEYYEYDLKIKAVQLKTPPIPLAAIAQPFPRLHQYYSDLGLSIQHLERALIAKDTDLVTFKGAPIKDISATRQEIMKLLNGFKQKREDFELMLAKNSSVLSEAVDYFYH